METFTASTGLNSVLTRGTSAQQSSELWRPWAASDGKPPLHQTQFVLLCDAKYFKVPQVVHPVKLYWPKSRCFDYLYQDAEMLLRCYPVQATICPYEDSSSEDDSDDEEEDAEKEQN